MTPAPVCVNINAFYLSNAALNIITDLITYALPVRMILNLQAPFKQKIAVGVMFSLGFLYVFPPLLIHTPMRPSDLEAL